MSTIHSNQVNLASSKFSFRDFSMDESNQKQDARLLIINNQKSNNNHLGNNDSKQTESSSPKTNFKMPSPGSRIFLNTNRSKTTESKSTVFQFSSASSNIDNNKRTLLPTPMGKPKLELRIFDQLIKVKTEIQNATETGRAEYIKPEPSNSSGSNRTILNTPQKDRIVKTSVFNFTKPKVEISESFVLKSEQTAPVTGIKTEKATQSGLTPENIKSETNCVNDSNNNTSHNENCAISRIKFDPTVGNNVSLNQTKIETLKPETEKRNGNLIQLNAGKRKFAISNSLGFADQINNSPTSTTAVRRKIIFSDEGKKNQTKPNDKTTGDMSNRLQSLFDVIASNSVRINTNFIFPDGCDGGLKPPCSSEELNFPRKNRFEGNKRKVLKAKRWGKGAQRIVKKMVISASSIPEKICKNWDVIAPSNKNTNLTVASYIRCRLSKFQAQSFRGRLEGEKISTLANVESGRKRRLSIDGNAVFQQAKRCRLTFGEDDVDEQESKEISILDFKKSCISKLEALEREWNEKINLELEAANNDYRRDLRQLQEQQSLETYTICLKHSHQVYNGAIGDVSRRHWKAFRQMQNKFLFKTQTIEKRRHMQLSALRNEFKETGEHVQTILDATEMSDFTDVPMLGNSSSNKSPNKFQRISIDAAVTLVKEDKIYDSFYTQEN